MQREKVVKLTGRFILPLMISFFAIPIVASVSLAASLEEIRTVIARKGSKWVCGETSVSRLHEHQKRLRLGLVRQIQTGTERVLSLSLQAPPTATPASLDWRSSGYVTAVRDQGNCGSCWAFATAAALESYILVKDETPNTAENRSEEILLSCSSAGSCDGGYIDTASDFIRSVGLPSETYFPYTASAADDACGNAQAGWQTNAYEIASWSYVNTISVSIDAIKNALATYGPLVTTMSVYYDFYSYQSGVYEYATGAYQGGHAILLVGYTDDPSVGGGGYFIAKNSWGTDWGEAGFFKIAYSQTSSPVQFGEWTIAYHPPASVPTVPSAPSVLTATAISNTAIRLSWTDNASNEDGFKIERCQGAGCSNFVQIASAVTNAVTYTNSGLTANTPYSYRVRAYNDGGNSGYSNTGSAVTLPSIQSLPAPASLTATPTSSTAIRLSWTDNASSESGFRIERCKGAGCSNFVQIATVGANAVTYTNSGLTANTPYSYRVRAYNAGGNSGYSNSGSAITPSSILPPATPASLTATPTSNTAIRLSWTDNASNESGFRIERCQGAGCSNFVQIATAVTNAVTYTNSGLTANTPYSYRVRAYNDGGNSGYSNTGSTVTPSSTPPPATPTGLSAALTYRTYIRLAWTDKSTNESGFKIERCKGAGCSNFAQIATVGANAVTYTNSGLTANTPYSYRVRAYNAGGNSGYSNKLSTSTRP